MVYANWDFYNRTWHGSMTAQEFERWSSRSSLEIDRATQGRAAAAPGRSRSPSCAFASGPLVFRAPPHRPRSSTLVEWPPAHLGTLQRHALSHYGVSGGGGQGFGVERAN